MEGPERRARIRKRYLRTTLVVFAVAAASAIAAGVAYDRQIEETGSLRDAIVPFAAFIVACTVAAICLLVFVQDVAGNARLTRKDRARWLSGFGLFPRSCFFTGGATQGARKAAPGEGPPPRSLACAR
jgi:hypothetical protein